MLTTQRKIEIAQAVMDHPDLGICGICYLAGLTNFKGKEIYWFKDSLYIFYRSIGGQLSNGVHCFELGTIKARTERIEFLKKYIEHLKQQENEPR